MVDEIIAPILLGLSKNPNAFQPTQIRGIRLAKTKLHWVGSDIVLAHTVWFRVDDENLAVDLLWIEVTDPEEPTDDDWGATPF